MINRIVDFSEGPARLRVHYSQLLVERPEDRNVSIPMADLAVVLVSHPQVTYTQAVLSALAEAGASFVACNRRHLPVGMLLPLAAHHAQVERFAAQARAPLPMRKRLWQQIVARCGQARWLRRGAAAVARQRFVVGPVGMTAHRVGSIVQGRRPRFHVGGLP